MAALKYTNNSTTTLNGGISSGATSIVLTSGVLFPTLGAGDYFWGTLSDIATGNTIEIVKVTARSGNTITVTRAQEGTSATAFLNGDRFTLRVTAAGLMNMAKLDGDNVFTGTNTIPGYATSGANTNITSVGNISSGSITASADITVPDEAYAVGWNSSLEVPTKNAVYDKIETLANKGTNSDITSLTALTNITATAVTVALDDKVLIRDTSDSNNIKTVTAQSIADLASSSSGVRLLKYTEITATNGTWAKQAGTTAIEVLCVGGGGAGGGADDAGECGFGGMSGEQVRGFLDTGLTSTFVATIGAGGSGVSGSNGNSGGTTSFTTSTPTTIASALGGLGGRVSSAGGGGTGANGERGVKRGGLGGTSNSGSAAGANSGAGGGGASQSISGNFLGGAGGSGIIYVWEYG